MSVTFRKGAFLPGTTQNITTSGTSQASSAFATSTSIIRVTCTQDIYIQLGNSPTASATGCMLITAGSAEFLAVDSVNNQKIAVIQVTSAGVCSITELA